MPESAIDLIFREDVVGKPEPKWLSSKTRLESLFTSSRGKRQT